MILHVENILPRYFAQKNVKWRPKCSWCVVFFFKKNAELKDEVGIVSTDLDES